VVRGDAAAEALASSVRSEFEDAVEVYSGAFPSAGAVVTILSS